MKDVLCDILLLACCIIFIILSVILVLYVRDESKKDMYNEAFILGIETDKNNSYNITSDCDSQYQAFEKGRNHRKKQQLEEQIEKEEIQKKLLEKEVKAEYEEPKVPIYYFKPYNDYIPPVVIPVVVPVVEFSVKPFSFGRNKRMGFRNR